MLAIATQRPILAAGALAGLLAGALIDLYLIVVNVLIAHSSTLAGVFQFAAAGLVGKVALDDPRYAWLGVVVHFSVSVLWAIGYAYVAARTPYVRERPFVSGLAFGFVVFVAMQLILVAANLYRTPTSASLGNALVAHLFAYGLPVAYGVRAWLGR